MGKLRSNRVKRIPQTGITSDRYSYLGLDQAEPNLGDPRVGPSSVGVNPIKAGSFYQLAAIGEYPGERFWSTQVGIGSTLGVISVYANNELPNSAFERIHGLNFVGTGVTLETPPLELFDGIGIATIRFTVTDILNQGDVGQLLYNSSNGQVKGASQLYFASNSLGIGTTNPSEKLEVIGNVKANQFKGKLSGTADYADVAGIATVAQGLTGVPNIIVGIATATEFIGPLTGVADTAKKLQTPRNFTISGSQFTAITTSFDGTANATIGLSLVNQVGLTSGVYGSSSLIPIVGVNSSGIVTSITAVNITDNINVASATTARDVIGGIGSITALSVSGISTLGTVKISSGIITATSGVVTYYGDGSKLTGIVSATTSTNVIGGIGSLSQLQVTGISTFTNGPVLIGRTSTTGTSSQPLQITGGAYLSGSVGIGTTNPTSDLDINGDIRIRGSLYDYNNLDGNSGQILQSIGTGVSWVDSSSIGSGSITVTEDSSDKVEYITFVSGTGDTTIGINTSNLTFNPYTGYLGIGTTSPASKLHITSAGITTGEALQVDGNIRVGASTISNYIAFRGTYYDDVNSPNYSNYTHTYVGERIYNSTQVDYQDSELVLFKGNDPYNLPQGPDRIRHIAAEHRFDTYVSAFTAAELSVGFNGICTSSKISNKVIITGDGNLGIGTTTPNSKLHVVGDTLITGVSTVGTLQATSIGIGTTAPSLYNLALNGSTIVRHQSVTAVGSTYTFDIGLASEFTCGASINGNTTFSLTNHNQLPAAVSGIGWRNRAVITFTWTSGTISFSASGYTFSQSPVTLTTGQTYNAILTITSSSTVVGVQYTLGRS